MNTPIFSILEIASQKETMVEIKMFVEVTNNVNKVRMIKQSVLKQFKRGTEWVKAKILCWREGKHNNPYNNHIIISSLHDIFWYYLSYLIKYKHPRLDNKYKKNKNKNQH